MKARVKRVVVGCVDPDLRVKGRGLAILKRAGIEVAIGVLQDESTRLNQGFITRVTRGRPMGLLKLAMSLDGRIAAEGGDSRWISSEASRELVHRWRAQSDAVMVGAGTVIADNPRLTCRIANGRDPVRVIVDARLRTSPNAHVYRQRSSAQTILVTQTSNLARAQKKYGSGGVEVFALSPKRGKLPLDPLMREFGRRGWCRVLIEGGANLAGSALEAGIVDRIAIFLAPKIIGAGLPAIDGTHLRAVRDAFQLSELSARPVGCDLLVEASLSANLRARSR